MLPRRYIEEWKEFAPWPEDAQVEQDLVIEKALLELYSDPFIQERLAFRGGTALHKIFLKPQVRYSEDIDLVQIKGEPIKDTKKLHILLKTRGPVALAKLLVLKPKKCWAPNCAHFIRGKKVVTYLTFTMR